MENRDSTEDSKTKIWKTMTQPKTQQKTQSRNQICMFSVFFPHVRQISQVVPSKSQFCSQVSPFWFFSSYFLHVFLPRRLNEKIQIQPKCQQKTQSRTRICMFSWLSRCSADFPSFSFKIRCCSQVSVVFFFGTLHNSRTTLQLQRQLQLQLEQLHYTPN